MYEMHGDEMGLTTHAPPPIQSTQPTALHYIEFRWWHDWFQDTTIHRQINIYTIMIRAVIATCWKDLSLFFLTTNQRVGIHANTSCKLSQQFKPSTYHNTNYTPWLCTPSLPSSWTKEFWIQVAIITKPFETRAPNQPSTIDQQLTIQLPRHKKNPWSCACSKWAPLMSQSR